MGEAVLREASLKRIDLKVTVAGTTFTHSFSPASNLTYPFQWSGQDAFGRTLQGRQAIVAHIDFVYDGVYQRVNRFGRPVAKSTVLARSNEACTSLEPPDRDFRDATRCRARSLACYFGAGVP